MTFTSRHPLISWRALLPRTSESFNGCDEQEYNDGSKCNGFDSCSQGMFKDRCSLKPETFRVWTPQPPPPPSLPHHLSHSVPVLSKSWSVLRGAGGRTDRQASGRDQRRYKYTLWTERPTPPPPDLNTTERQANQKQQKYTTLFGPCSLVEEDERAIKQQERTTIFRSVLFFFSNCEQNKTMALCSIG